MSRILRRPMFRGGRVSSYGTGIAAPLVPGYAGGGRIGFNMGGGQFKTGSEVVKEAPGIFGFKFKEPFMSMASTTFPTSNQIAVEETGKINEVETTGEEEVVNKGKGEQWEYWDALGEYGEMPMKLERTPEEVLEDNYTRITTLINKGKFLNSKDREFAEKHGLKMYNELFDIKGNPINTQTSIDDVKTIVGAPEKETIDPDQEWKDKIAALEAQLAAKAEEPEVDAKTAVAENKELFRDLLGYDKAKGQDISDMLLGFAGAEGDDTWSKTKSFFKDEAKRPGRAQKISDAAGTLAIQDYISGKRSKEKMMSDKSKIDYAQDVKIKALIPSLDDDLSTALTKFAHAYDAKPNSDVTLRELIKFKTKEPVFRVEMKIEDLEKKKKKLKVGYNIIQDENQKIFVKFDGTTADIQTLDEIWSS